jgi:hypothetical protein
MREFHAVDDTQFRVSGLRDTQYNTVRASRPTKMGTEVVGTLMHADAPQGNAPHSVP